MAAVTRWLCEPAPLGRLAAFRTLVYLFVIADLLVVTPWVRAHAYVPGELYQPLLVGRVLPLPTPTPTLVWGVFAALLVTAAVAATGRLPKLAGIAVAVLYFEWMVIAMSYGKVDHDRFALLVALAVLPTVGRARHGDTTRSAAAGWALRVTQIAVIATYFLAAWAKLRIGGLEWLTSATLTWAFVRRGTPVADLMVDHPWTLVAAQIGIVAFELASPLVFVLRRRWRYAAVGFFYLFHAMTIATVTISFLPHLVAMTSFLPLERVRPVTWLRRGGRPVGEDPGRPVDEHSGTAAPDAAGDPGAAGGSGALGGEPVPDGLRQSAGGGAAGHAVPVAGDPPVGGPGERSDRGGPQQAAD